VSRQRTDVYPQPTFGAYLKTYVNGKGPDYTLNNLKP
jgi:hypothetical protein